MWLMSPSMYMGLLITMSKPEALLNNNSTQNE